MLIEQAKRQGLQISSRKITDIEHGRLTANRCVEAYATTLGVPAKSLYSGAPSDVPLSTGSGVTRWFLDFTRLIQDRTEGFVGRATVFESVRNFLADGHSGYLLITGQPGIGKSALLAHFVSDPSAPVPIYHFNSLSEGFCTLRQMLGNICARLISEYGLPYDELPADFDASTATLSVLLEEAAKKLAKGKSLVVAIDALDEVQHRRSGPRQESLLLPGYLPTGIKFILTSRVAADVRVQGGRMSCLHMDAHAPENLEDIARFVRGRISPAIQKWCWEKHPTTDEFIDLLCRKSDGNFMYLRHALSDLEQGRYALLNGKDLPQGLRAYYRAHWQRMQKADAELFSKIYEPVVCSLAAARKPLEMKEIVSLTEVNRFQVLHVLREWREYLAVDRREKEPTRYSIYHESFRDFLREEVDLEFTVTHGRIVDTIQGTPTARRRKNRKAGFQKW
jgi:hypothetical protein